jgi:excisionase family DNA binding protein
MGRDYFFCREVAAMLGVSARCVRGWAVDGKIPAVRIGPRGKLMIPKEGLRTAIELETGRPAQPTTT